MSEKILVAYATKYGSTQEVAQSVADTLRQQGLEVDVQAVRDAPAPGEFRAVVLGAPLYIGHWLKDMQRYVTEHQQALTNLPVAVFSLGPIESNPEEWQGARQQFENEVGTYPWLDPVAAELFGGVFDPARLSFLHKLLAILPASPLYQKPASDARDWEAIRAWVTDLASKL